MKIIERLYALFLKIVNSLQSPFLLFIRIVFGWQFLETGIGHFTHMDKTVDYFTELHIPAPAFTARFTSGLETVGGILLILGLASRLISVPLLINMTVAFLTAERDKFMSFFAEDSGPFFSADAFPFLLVSLLILIFGPGFFSYDTLIAAYRKRSIAIIGRAKLFCLLWVLLMLVCLTFYAGFGGDAHELITHWCVGFIAIGLGGLAYGGMRI